MSRGGVLASDGSVLWIIDDVRDGTPIGTVRPSLFVPNGYVKANGATVNRSDYPRLVAMANAYSLWTSDTAANPGLFGEGDGSATMELPDYTERMIQLTETGVGSGRDAGLPNLIGRTTYGTLDMNGPDVGCTYFYLTNPNQDISRNTSNLANYGYFNIDASRANPIYSNSQTVQPPAINVYPIMRY